MKVHEYQAKALLREHGVSVPEGELCTDPEAAARAAERLLPSAAVVALKAQVQAGGRGKAGGIRLARSVAEARRLAGEMLGMTLVTPQTGPGGKVVSRLLVEQGLAIERELYVAVTFDRAQVADVLIASREGGVEIEELAARSPERILTVTVDPLAGLQPFQARSLAYGLGLRDRLARAATETFLRLYRAYRDCEAALAEINPLVVTAEGELVALDAKMNLDDNALFRHPEWPPCATRAGRPAGARGPAAGVNYIKLDGNVGCMVNGAGLAMATMDIIKQAGGEPANFLDVGGGANAETIGKGFQHHLQAINGSGGADQHLRRYCALRPGGPRSGGSAAPGWRSELPVVVRLEGTNAAEGRQIIEQAGLGFRSPRRLSEAARKAVTRGPGGGGADEHPGSRQTPGWLVQGITGGEGSFHARQMLDYGTNVVAGVTPGSGGEIFEGRSRSSTRCARR